MARSDQQLPQHLKRLDDLDGYGVEEGDLDPRGWTVVSTDGRTLGTVEDLIVDTTTMKVRYFEVDLADTASTSSVGDDYVLVDAATARVDEGRRQVVGDLTSYGSPYGTGQAAAATSSYAAGQGYTERTSEYGTEQASSTETDAARLTRSEEELRIGKREVARGEARVAKRVETEHVREPVTVRREEVVIERRPVAEGAEAAAPIREGEIRVPLMEEEVVVDKRPVVKEEIVIGKRVVEDSETVEADLRKERFEVEDDSSVAADRESSRKKSRRDDR